jgi:uncharacterized protein (TIGR02246 family)
LDEKERHLSGNQSGLSAEDRFAIADLITEFGRRVDHGEAESVAELFVEDGALVTPMFHLKGRQQIAEHFARRNASGDIVSRHQWSNLKLTPTEDGRVLAEMIVQTHLGKQRAAGPVQPDHMMVGDSIDVVVRDEAGAWRFVERRLVVAFRAESVPPPAQGSPPARG